MFSTNPVGSRANWQGKRVWCALAAASVAFLLGAPCVARAVDVVQIEEDWELDLNTPSTADGAPQLTCLISPTGDTSSYYAVLQINQRTSPSGQVGGLQQQLCNGGSLVSVQNGSDTSVLATANEKIQWTQRMSVSNGQLTIQVVGGTSQTWGKFGSGNELQVSASTSLTNLNGYDPNVSSANSGVDYGNNRVGKLILRKVRTYTSNGNNNVEQVLDRVVYQYP